MSKPTYNQNRDAYRGVDELRSAWRKRAVVAAVIILALCVIALRLVQAGGVR